MERLGKVRPPSEKEKKKRKKPLGGTRGRGGIETWQGGKRKQPERSRFWKLSPNSSPKAGKGLGETDIEGMERCLWGEGDDVG